MPAPLAAVWLCAVLMQAPMFFHDVDKGSRSGIDEGRQAIVRTERDWTALWRQHDPNRPAPPVDFKRDMVVAVFLGSRPTAGYSAEIADVAVSGDTLVVRYRERRPQADAIAAQVLTFPFHMVSVPARPGRATFESIE